jgi:hypothetical protein
MLRIRESQLAALRERPTPPATDSEIAQALRDLEWFDFTNVDHRRIIGASPGDGEEVVFALLTRFAGFARARAAHDGITHQYLLPEYASFYFRYSFDWPSRADVSLYLDDASLREAEKMKRIARRLRLAHLGRDAF